MRKTIRKVVQGVHMGLGHVGLAHCLKKQGIDIYALADDDLIMFVNRQGDKLKVLGGKGKVLGYLRMPKGQKIEMGALQYLPRTFGAGGFNYDAACMRALQDKLGSKAPPRAKVSPLDAARAARAS